MSITIEGPGANVLPQHLGFTLRHDRGAYLWGLALLRALLLILTVTGTEDLLFPSRPHPTNTPESLIPGL